MHEFGSESTEPTTDEEVTFVPREGWRHEYRYRRSKAAQWNRDHGDPKRRVEPAFVGVVTAGNQVAVFPIEDE